MSALLVAFLALDAVMKVAVAAPAVDASEHLGLPKSAVPGIGLVLLGCTLLYAIPPTAVLGAILLTGYLGGAAAIHVRAAGGSFPVAFSIGLGVLAWVALALREPPLFRLLLRRR